MQLKEGDKVRCVKATTHIPANIDGVVVKLESNLALIAWGTPVNKEKWIVSDHVVPWERACPEGVITDDLVFRSKSKCMPMPIDPFAGMDSVDLDNMGYTIPDTVRVNDTLSIAKVPGGYIYCFIVGSSVSSTFVPSK